VRHAGFYLDDEAGKIIQAPFVDIPRILWFVFEQVLI